MVARIPTKQRKILTPPLNSVLIRENIKKRNQSFYWFHSWFRESLQCLGVTMPKQDALWPKAFVLGNLYIKLFSNLKIFMLLVIITFRIIYLRRTQRWMLKAVINNRALRSLKRLQEISALILHPRGRILRKWKTPTGFGEEQQKKYKSATTIK